jgi:DNA (cytosine-5)-methyltransferase 1
VKVVRAADLFCGAGGTSTGLLRAADRLGRRVDLLAVNHWPEAIATHRLNHEGVRHLCEDLGAIDPRRAVPEGRLDLLVASPECTSHSYSRGGRPISEQSRATAWHPLRWADQLRVDAIIIENVPQFRDWGPTDRRGRPIAARKGETYRQYLDMLRAMGFTVDARVLNAADYGAATTRRRLFIIGRKGSRKIRWPEPTHAPAGQLELGRRPWRAAKEIIDWSLVGESIFARRKPLAPKTRERILMGAEKFWPALRPYLVVLRNHMAARDVEQPIPTLAAGGRHMGVAEPFIVNVSHSGNAGRVRSAAEPIPSLTGSREKGLASVAVLMAPPFILPHRQFDGMQVDSIDRPIRTVTAKGGSDFGLVEPVLSDGERDEPAGKPFLVPFFGERDGQKPRTHSVDDPLPTGTSHGAGGVVSPFLVNYYGTGHADSVEEPIGTLTTKDRYGLVTPHGIAIGDGLYLDIRFRMLKPHELAAAMGFPADYQFHGAVDARVKQIGNAVEVHQAEALCFAVLA